MNLAKHVAEELTNLAGQVTSADEFFAHYEQLLAMFIAAQRTMKQLAVMHGRYLQAQLVERGREN